MKPLGTQTQTSWLQRSKLRKHKKLLRRNRIIGAVNKKRCTIGLSAGNLGIILNSKLKEFLPKLRKTFNNFLNLREASETLLNFLKNSNKKKFSLPILWNLQKIRGSNYLGFRYFKKNLLDSSISQKFLIAFKILFNFLKLLRSLEVSENLQQFYNISRHLRKLTKKKFQFYMDILHFWSKEPLKLDCRNDLIWKYLVNK